MTRALFFTYGAAVYVAFLGTFLYAIGFIENIGVPKSIDSGTEGPFWESIVVNLLLLGAFGLQHSVMARPAFKKWWTKIIPPPIERTTFVLFTNLVLILMFWQWRPMKTTVWHIETDMVSKILQGISVLGWLIVLYATFLIDHFELFGFKQVLFHLRGRGDVSKQFRTPGLYRWVRHPIMLGFLIAFWATPVMTQGHLLFAVVTTSYILVAIQIEEHDLLAFFGDHYAQYRRRTPMLIPLPSFRRG